MPGSDGPTLRISAKCTCDAAGHTITLELDNEGIIDDPDVQVFRGRVQEPQAGAPVMTEEDVHYKGPADPRAKRVVIRLPDGRQESVDIQDVS
jgi:hypothetical protein